MVTQRRFGPLVVLLAAGFSVLAARLFQIQVLEHRVWAGEAQRLVRSSRVLPYHRGLIVDRLGRELVRDEDEYALEFRYRDFRRGHPIGLVAHAWSALLERTMTLQEASVTLEGLALGMLELSPADLDRFARGEEVSRARLAAVSDPAAHARSARAADARYYLAQLLALTRQESRALRELEGAAREAPYVEAVAKLRGIDRGVLASELVRALVEGRERLERLADLLPSDDARVSTRRLDELVQRIEALRERQEDDVADALFREAAGFAPGRIARDDLARFELSWLANAMRWDEARLSAWTASRRARHERTLERDTLPRVLVRADLELDARAQVERLLDGLAQTFARDGAPSWRELDEFAVLGELESLATARLPGDARAREPLFALDDPDVRALADEGSDPWTLFGVVVELALASSPERRSSASASAALWRELAASREGLDGERALNELAAVARALESRFQAECARGIEALASRSDGGRIVLAAPRLERAEQRERFAWIDAQSRPLLICARPSLDLVHEVERWPERYRGFEVRETTRRRALVHDAAGAPCASLLIGGVRRPSLRELFAQSDDERRLDELEHALVRSDAEEAEMRVLASRLARPDEWTGSGGIEDLFDAELRGRFGYVEARGLADEERALPARVEAPIDGQDLELTLDADLQLAAQETLRRPEPPPSGESYDRTFFENPVGAIVLCTVDGEVLAAASEPATSGHASVPGRDRERSIVRERTLTRPTFNPPGSAFKPFVAAFALGELAFDPRTRYECLLLEDGKPGFDQMHCNKLHVSTDLGEALASSCNSYFAQLALCYEPEQMLAMTSRFGFGEPTGVRAGRRGLREDFELPARDGLARALEDRANRMRYANGLGLIEATPMQLARATCGIATGLLPEMALVRAVDGERLPREARELGIPESSLAIVRDAMAQCVTSSIGSAHHKRLDEGTLGFTFACKTGSADLGPFQDIPELSADDRRALELGRVRKHTWVVGWFPAQAPKAVVVVYLHEVAETASHTAVWIASQFLRSPAVRAYALEEVEQR